MSEPSELEGRERELQLLRSQLQDARRDVDAWRLLAERQRRQLERVRSLPGVGRISSGQRRIAPARRRAENVMSGPFHFAGAARPSGARRRRSSAAV